jgi:hypothetical protein
LGLELQLVLVQEYRARQVLATRFPVQQQGEGISCSLWVEESQEQGQELEAKLEEEQGLVQGFLEPVSPSEQVFPEQQEPV